MRKVDSSIFVRFDNVAVYLIQPIIAVISLVNLVDSDSYVSAFTRPYWTWGGIFLVQLIFLDDIWSFAVRHEERQRIVILWIKLLAAGICSILTFAGIYRHMGLMDQGQISHDPGTALYFSISAWSTVGYGDVVPSIDARPFAAAQSLIGVIYDSAIIGLVLYASTRVAASGKR